MKAISVREPWASFVAKGLKRFETRSWSTRCRGELLICAGKTVNENCIEISCLLAEFRGAGVTAIDEDSYYRLPFGKALCVVDLIEVHSTPGTPWRGQPILLDWKLSEAEKALGDFSPNRFAFELVNVRRFKEPWPWPGALGLFTVPDEEIEKHELEPARGNSERQ